jgi:hypothetical protein
MTLMKPSASPISVALPLRFMSKRPAARALLSVWESLRAQIGADYERKRMLAQRVREVMPDVLTAYPHALVELSSTGLTMKPSQPAVPRPIVNGFRLVSD